MNLLSFLRNCYTIPVVINRRLAYGSPSIILMPVAQEDEVNLKARYRNFSIR